MQWEFRRGLEITGLSLEYILPTMYFENDLEGKNVKGIIFLKYVN